MFSPACSPAWRATEPSCGRTVVRLRVGDPGDVADGEHLGVAGDAEVRLGREAVAVLQLDAERLDEGVRLQAGAPHQRVRVEHRPRLERDAGRLDRRDHLAQQHLDAALLQRALACRSGCRP